VAARKASTPALKRSPQSASREGDDGSAKKRRIGYEARRKVITEAALEVFAKVGYQAASLDEIASRAGITKPVLYDHFESKSALHLALLTQERDALLAHVSDRLQGDGATAQNVADALDAFYAWVETHPFAWMMLFRESTGDPDVIEAHRKIQAEAHLAVVELLARGSELDGPDVDDEVKQAMAAAIGGATHGVARWWYDNRQVPREQIVALVMDILWMGLERARAGKRWRPKRRS
jgi:AcrR family transcriptional regulator